jgi:hypothetical protein
VLPVFWRNVGDYHQDMMMTTMMTIFFFWVLAVYRLVGRFIITFSAMKTQNLKPSGLSDI